MTELEMTGLLLKLADTGITGIAIYYEGGGDSGAVEKVVYTKDPCNDAEDVESAIDDVWSAMGIDGIDTALSSQIEDFAYKLLEDVEDWYNNEGGWGTIWIHVPSGEYTINNTIRIVETESFAHSGNVMNKTIG